MFLYILFLFSLCSGKSHGKCGVKFSELYVDNLRGRENAFVEPTSEFFKFSWSYEIWKSDCEILRDIVQESFKLRVLCDGKNTFESQVILSNESTNVYFQMKLPFSANCSVSVDSKINACEESISSTFPFFTTMDPSLWNNADFLIGENLFLSHFSLGDYSEKTSISKAFLFLVGIGYNRPYINGFDIGKRILEPAWTNYNETILYSAYEVSSLLSLSSINSIGIEIGNGWFGCSNESCYYGKDAIPGIKLILQVFVNDEQQQQQQIIEIFSNSKDFRTSKGPIIYDSIYNGEHFNANLEQQGWKNPSFPLNSSSLWIYPQVWNEFLSSKKKNISIQLQKRPPIMDIEEFEPIQIIPKLNETTKEVYYLIDFGQNFAGVCELWINGSKNQRIELKHAEILTKDGNDIYIDNLRTAQATDIYFLRGDKQNGETFRPKFTYHGFRYVKLIGALSEKDFKIKAFHFSTSVLRVGYIEFEDGHILNNLQKAILYSQQSNLMSIPTDCPSRDERLGWDADAYISSIEASYNYDMSIFYENLMHSYSNILKRGEFLSDVVPYIPRFGNVLEIGDPTWTSVLFYLMDTQYDFYGDINILSNFYDSLATYIKILDSKVSNLTDLSKFYNCKYGDWCPPPPRTNTLKEYTASFFWVLCLDRMKEFSIRLDRSPNEIKYYELLHEKYQRLFVNSFFEYEKEKKQPSFADNSQTSLSLSHSLGLWSKEEGLSEKLE